MSVNRKVTISGCWSDTSALRCGDWSPPATTRAHREAEPIEPERQSYTAQRGERTHPGKPKVSFRAHEESRPGPSCGEATDERKDRSACNQLAASRTS